ncbi:hypothetical protein [Sphingobium sp. MP9-4]|uniref:hypothetical protein n=1 Tax=Sphingobium sp. MP9-4 TaxID=1761936 RepID=UPI001F0D32D9|nr:hypothetical protein [Sphingobium sp. MP9-4]
MRKLPSSLRLRLTGAVMMPLTALVLVFSVITALVNHNTEAGHGRPGAGGVGPHAQPCL